MNDSEAKGGVRNGWLLFFPGERSVPMNYICISGS